MDASNTGEARMSEVLSFPGSPIKRKMNHDPFRFRSVTPALSPIPLCKAILEATITDSDQSSILSIDDGSEIEFNTSEKSASTVSDCIIKVAIFEYIHRYRPSFLKIMG
jgi:hypothetical protein